MTQDIQRQINLLKNTKSDLRTAIMEKGVTVYPADLFSTYPTRISQISTQAGTYDDSLKKLLDGSYTSYSIPDGTEMIRSGAFQYYTGLTSVTIPSGVTSIGALAFWYCTGLQSITCLATTPPTLGTEYADLSPQGPFYQTNNCPIYVPAASVQAYKTAWPQYESRIQAIVTNEVFNSIVDRSISGDFVIPDGVTAVNHFAFFWCQSLTSVTIPSSVTAIGYSSFDSCRSLTSITCLATTPPALQYDYTFYDTNNCPIYVPAESVSAYKSASGWSAYASRITAIQ